MSHGNTLPYHSPQQLQGGTHASPTAPLSSGYAPGRAPQPDPLFVKGFNSVLYVQGAQTYRPAQPHMIDVPSEVYISNPLQEVLVEQQWDNPIRGPTLAGRSPLLGWCVR